MKTRSISSSKSFQTGIDTRTFHRKTEQVHKNTNNNSGYLPVGIVVVDAYAASSKVARNEM